MEKTVQRLARPFESSSGKTPEYMEFVRTLKKEMITALHARGCDQIVFNVGHFYVSVFFTDRATGQAWYICTPDVRFFGGDRWYYRSVKDYKDHHGARHRSLDVHPDMIAKMDLTV